MAGSADITGVQHYVQGIGHPQFNALQNDAPALGTVNFVLSPLPPNNADGKPDGTVYIQSAS